jgi:hypothetical protein
MARPRLSSNRRNAAKAVADKIAGKTSSATSVSSPMPTMSVPVSSKTSAIAATQGDISVPGLIDFTPDKIAGMLPQFDDSKYQVTDPLNPPESIPQLSQQAYDKAEGIYQGGIRALKASGLSFDLTKERFTTLKKKVSAFGSGVKLATEVERVKGDFLDYLNQGESNKQKNIALNVATHKTATDSQKAVYDVQTLDEKLEHARIAADMATAQTQKHLSGLTEFQKQLSGQK